MVVFLVRKGPPPAMPARMMLPTRNCCSLPHPFCPHPPMLLGQGNMSVSDLQVYAAETNAALHKPVAATASSGGSSLEALSGAGRAVHTAQAGIGSDLLLWRSCSHSWCSLVRTTAPIAYTSTSPHSLLTS